MAVEKLPIHWSTSTYVSDGPFNDVRLDGERADRRDDEEEETNGGSSINKSITMTWHKFLQSYLFNLVGWKYIRKLLISFQGGCELGRENSHQEIILFHISNLNGKCLCSKWPNFALDALGFTQIRQPTKVKEVSGQIEETLRIIWAAAKVGDEN